MDKLTNREIDILIEGVDEWVNKGWTDGLMGGLFTALLSDKMDEKAKADMKAKEQAEEAKRNEAKAIRKEHGIMLKAKLLMMKDRNHIAELERSV